MKVELTDIIQVTTEKKESKLVSIADIIELVTKPEVKPAPKKTTPAKGKDK